MGKTKYFNEELKKKEYDEQMKEAAKDKSFMERTVKIQKEFEAIEDEIKRIVDFVCKQQIAQYDKRFESLDVPSNATKGVDSEDVKEEYDDPLYDDIVEFVVKTGKASAAEKCW